MENRNAYYPNTEKSSFFSNDELTTQVTVTSQSAVSANRKRKATDGMVEISATQPQTSSQHFLHEPAKVTMLQEKVTDDLAGHASVSLNNPITDPRQMKFKLSKLSQSASQNCTYPSGSSANNGSRIDPSVFLSGAGGQPSAGVGGGAKKRKMDALDCSNNASPVMGSHVQSVGTTDLGIMLPTVQPQHQVSHSQSSQPLQPQANFPNASIAALSSQQLRQQQQQQQQLQAQQHLNRQVQQQQQQAVSGSRQTSLTLTVGQGTNVCAVSQRQQRAQLPPQQAVSHMVSLHQICHFIRSHVFTSLLSPFDVII